MVCWKFVVFELRAVIESKSWGTFSFLVVPAQNTTTVREEGLASREGVCVFQRTDLRTMPA